MSKTGQKKNSSRTASLNSKLTSATVVNYFILGMVIMLFVTSSFMYYVIRSHYSDTVDMARTIRETLESTIDVSELVDAVLLQERSDTDGFESRMEKYDPGDNDGQLLNYRWYSEKDPPLAKRDDCQYVMDVLYIFGKNNKNLNGSCFMVFDKKTHIAGLLCDVEKFGESTPVKADYVMWRRFEDVELDHIEEERWSLVRNLYRYMSIDPRYVVFAWYEPVAYEDENVIVFIEADAFYKKLWSNVLFVIAGFVLFLLIIVAVIGVMYHKKMDSLIIEPIQDISEAAKAYASDQMSGQYGKNHFSSIGISSGDELEALAHTLDEMEGDLGRFVDELTNATAERERVAAELNLAANIQMGMLPDKYPDRPEFDLCASIEPAKEVGGDFYDYFMIDDDHLALVIADVSGKGISSALFMVIARTLIKYQTEQGLQDPAEIFNTVNRELIEVNRARLFVTAWLGILELSTGRLKYVNAGHKAPVLRKDGNPFRIEKDVHGLVLAASKKMTYNSREFTLKPGDALFVYTDGVTEAMNAMQELFGEEPMLKALNEAPDADPETLVANVEEAIADFVRDTPQFDDTTMLCMKYNGEAYNNESEKKQGRNILSQNDNF